MSIEFVLVLVIHFFLAFGTANANFKIIPRKMLIISYSVASTTHVDDLARNPIITNRLGSFRFFIIHRVIRPVRFFSCDDNDDVPTIPHTIHIQRSTSTSSPFDHTIPYFGIPKFVQDQLKDIFMVVTGSMFGVGCGVIMYLTWQMFLCRYEEALGGGYECDVEEEDSMEGGYKVIDENPKKTATG